MSPARVLLATLGAAALAAALVVAVLHRDPEASAPGAGPGRFDPDSAVELRVERVGEVVVAERQGGVWRITVPRALGADPDVVRGMLQRLANPEPVRVLAAPAGLATYGLAAPRAKITARTSEGRTTGLELGGPDPFAGGTFARSLPDGRVLVVRAEVARGLDRGSDELRNRRLVHAPVREAKRVVIEHGAERVVLVRSGAGSWSLAGRAPADDAAVRGLLSMLAELRAEKYLGAVAELERPGAELSAELPKGRVRIALMRREDGTVVARTEGERVQVPEGAWRSVTRPAEEWLSPMALRFERGAVAAVRIVRPGVLLVLSRSRDGPWEMLAPRAAPVSGDAVRRLLVGLGALRVVAREKREPAAVGLAPPSLEISLEDERGQLLDGLLVGRRAGDYRYAKSARWPGVFRLEAEALEALPTTAKALR